MVVKAETPISREKLSNKKKKNKKSKDITEPSKTEKPNVIAFNENIQQPTIEHVSKLRFSISPFILAFSHLSFTCLRLIIQLILELIMHRRT